MEHRIETPRLYLRPWTEVDVPLWHQLSTDVGYNVFAPPGAFLVADDDGARAAIRARRALLADGLGKWPAFTRETDLFVGTCGLDPCAVRGEPSVELGFRLLLAHWGCGFGTELARAMLQYGLDTLGRTRVHAFALPQNRASRAILHKIAMVPDGLLEHGGLIHDLFVTPKLTATLPTSASA